MRFTSLNLCLTVLSLAVFTCASSASAEQPGWDGKRHISYQQQKDLFYNYYAQPGPYNGAANLYRRAQRPIGDNPTRPTRERVRVAASPIRAKSS